MIAKNRSLVRIPPLPNIIVLDTELAVDQFREAMAGLSDASYDLDEIVEAIFQTLRRIPPKPVKSGDLLNYRELAWVYARGRSPTDQFIVLESIDRLAKTIAIQLYRMGVDNQQQLHPFVFVGWMGKQLVLINKLVLEHTPADSPLANWLRRYGIARLNNTSL